MTRDLGVWTAEDSVLVLIDCQKEMFEVIRSKTNADLVELHVRLLAKTAKAFGMPIVLSTVGVEYGFNGPTLPSIPSELDGIEPIDRSSMNAFEDSAFREAVRTTGKMRLIIGGLHTEICLTFASVQALKDGCEVMYVADAVGGRSQTAHRTAIERLAHAGAVPTTGARRRDGALPRLGNAARWAGRRRHLLVLQRGPEAHRPGGCCGGGEACRCSRRGPLSCRAGWASKACVVTGAGGSMGGATA
jgi:nicotinamidase-related amidase